VREHADGATPREEGMSIDERSTPELDGIRGNIGAGTWMSAEDEALVEQEQAAMNVAALMPSGATLVPAPRFYSCVTCAKVLAIPCEPANRLSQNRRKAQAPQPAQRKTVTARTPRWCSAPAGARSHKGYLRYWRPSCSS